MGATPGAQEERANMGSPPDLNGKGETIANFLTASVEVKKGPFWMAGACTRLGTHKANKNSAEI